MQRKLTLMEPWWEGHGTLAFLGALTGTRRERCGIRTASEVSISTRRKLRTAQQRQSSDLCPSCPAPPRVDVSSFFYTVFPGIQHHAHDTHRAEHTRRQVTVARRKEKEYTFHAPMKDYLYFWHGVHRLGTCSLNCWWQLAHYKYIYIFLSVSLAQAGFIDSLFSY